MKSMQSKAGKKQASAASKAGKKATIIKVSTAATSSQSVETQAYNQLQQVTKIKSCLELGSFAEEGNGLLLSSQKKGKNEVLMAVPKGLAIVMDYNEGLQISNGQWPRLRQGASSPEPLPWDMLMALALLDGLAGDGDSFWGPWCQAVLPPPEALTLPMTWGKQKLEQLQHSSIIEGALKQQERLTGLFPELMDTEGMGDCSWFQWAFACVRSRAFKITDDIFAFVPFLDMANHSARPNANFKLNAASGAFELVALEEVEKGQHVTISYSGESGLTNQRFMAQYGFVPSGNPADRIEFEVPSNLKAESPDKLLQLSRVQERFGDTVLMDAASGKNPYMWAALKSLPFAPEADEASSSGEDHLELARNLHMQCESMLQGFQTTIEEDEQILAAPSTSGSSNPAGRSPDSPLSTLTVEAAEPWYLAAVKYRLERKRLIRACRLVLSVYTRAD
mmetsp:Transcript_24477/g.66812  ORF Transcript_24477/g.66812 Transcript_24477/m.66812 type:complete len:450 (-) Transcript_24477:151-1500(-)